MSLFNFPSRRRDQPQCVEKVLFDRRRTSHKGPTCSRDNNGNVINTAREILGEYIIRHTEDIAREDDVEVEAPELNKWN